MRLMSFGRNAISLMIAFFQSATRLMLASLCIQHERQLNPLTRLQLHKCIPVHQLCTMHKLRNFKNFLLIVRYSNFNSYLVFHGENLDKNPFFPPILIEFPALMVGADFFPLSFGFYVLFIFFGKYQHFIRLSVHFSAMR